MFSLHYPLSSSPPALVQHCPALHLTSLTLHSRAPPLPLADWQEKKVVILFIFNFIFQREQKCSAQINNTTIILSVIYVVTLSLLILLSLSLLPQYCFIIVFFQDYFFSFHYSFVFLYHFLYSFSFYFQCLDIRVCSVLFCTVLYCTVMYCSVLYCTVLYCTVLYCTVLYYPLCHIKSYHIVSCRTILHKISLSRAVLSGVVTIRLLLSAPLCLLRTLLCACVCVCVCAYTYMCVRSCICVCLRVCVVLSSACSPPFQFLRAYPSYPILSNAELSEHV